MATYVIGDVQGQYRELRRLLRCVSFDANRDHLWLVGDLVNRGPRSLEVLRFVRDLGEAATAVLGNHDLYLLGRAFGVAPKKRRDTLDAVLRAKDKDELIAWLRQRPLMAQRATHVMVHAGLLPQWSIPLAARLASEVEGILQSRDGPRLLAAYVESRADVWSAGLRGLARWTVILNVFTRLRTCTAAGRMRLDFAGPPEEAPASCIPWFRVRGRRSATHFIVFGHWAALGVRRGRRYAALDSGCSWGGPLSAFRFEDQRLFAVPREEVSASRR